MYYVRVNCGNLLVVVDVGGARDVMCGNGRKA